MFRSLSGSTAHYFLIASENISLSPNKTIFYYNNSNNNGSSFFAAKTFFVKRKKVSKILAIFQTHASLAAAPSNNKCVGTFHK